MEYTFARIHFDGDLDIEKRTDEKKRNKEKSIIKMNNVYFVMGLDLIEKYFFF